MIPLSIPNISGNELKYVKDCLDTGWISSAGEYVHKFENDKWTINTQIENLLDKHYETASKYRMQGRSFFFDIKRRWK